MLEYCRRDHNLYCLVLASSAKMGMGGENSLTVFDLSHIFFLCLFGMPHTAVHN